jgi:hypothetical protein
MSDHDELTRRAEALAPELTGLSRTEAERRAAERGVHVRFVPEGRAVTTEYVFGRVTAWLRDDVVAGATVG